ncbi:DUF3788 family protein [Heliorestis acidaminivorans]|uniref:DUF3788 family protein n=1 Tax=Heliorestis acidaminivorans TaxID=553427 RepID=A0A6I0F100_9FIRM|nr:DUF3788 family protein [Heliorestis acidaminivorans]
MEEAYQAKPHITYSKCSAQPGWNVKYKKSGKSLCTLNCTLSSRQWKKIKCSKRLWPYIPWG